MLERKLFGCRYRPYDSIHYQGWIRCNDGSFLDFEKLVELPIKPITEKQYEALVKWLDEVSYYIQEIDIEIGIEKTKGKAAKYIFFNKYNFKDTNVDEIIKEIKREYEKIKKDLN